MTKPNPEWYVAPCFECKAKPGQPCKDTHGPDWIHGTRYNAWWQRHFTAALRGPTAASREDSKG